MLIKRKKLTIVEHGNKYKYYCFTQLKNLNVF